ncbi:MAG: Fe-S center protein [Legionella sp. 40-6]|nr:SseB family protein [Legionella sp.]OJY37006.1 MAG: Fe-S center protein [Legionella sp. 40-6]
MNALEQAVQAALEASGSSQTANKAYLEFIKANFIIPIERAPTDDEPQVLFLTENNQVFLPVFTESTYLDVWAQDIAEKINILKLSGVDLLKGIGDGITVCLNPGSTVYKEFNPAEIARMRSMILKFFKD